MSYGMTKQMAKQKLRPAWASFQSDRFCLLVSLANILLADSNDLSNWEHVQADPSPHREHTNMYMYS